MLICLAVLVDIVFLQINVIFDVRVRMDSRVVVIQRKYDIFYSRTMMMMSA